MKLNECIKLWKENELKEKVKSRTYLEYEEVSRIHIIPQLGEFKLRKINNNILNNFIENKKQKGNMITGDGLSVNTINLIISVLNQLLNYAYNNKLIKKELRIKRLNNKNSIKRIEVFTHDEKDIIEKYCLNHKKNNYFGIVLCLNTGIRLGELLALTWDDIDFQKKELTINKNVKSIRVNNKTIKDVSTPKTNSSNRIIPIPETLIPYLKKIKRENNSKYLITNIKKDMVDTRSYQKLYERLLKRLNITYRNFHVLRHTFATNALETGIDIKSLSEILGHANPSITMSIYTHPRSEYKAKKINELGKLINTKK